MKGNKKIVIISSVLAVIVLVIIVIGIITIQSDSEKKSETTDIIVPQEKNTNFHSNLNPEDMTVEINTAKDFTEPGENALNIEEIQGFVPKKNNITPQNNTENTNNEVEGKEKPSNDMDGNMSIILSDTNLTVESIGSYTGNYLEDGTDDPIENVASMVLTNHSDQMLQVADITFQVSENESAYFRVTNLLPGASVLVLEATRRIYQDTDNYSYGDVATAYLDSPTLLEDKFQIISEDGKITLKNKTKNSYKKVYVYYKYAQMGGAYLGGITYRVPFENIEDNMSVDSVANHFNQSTSRIIDVQIAEQ